jgi:hypothetical protein
MPPRLDPFRLSGLRVRARARVRHGSGYIVMTCRLHCSLGRHKTLSKLATKADCRGHIRCLPAEHLGYPFRLPRQHGADDGEDRGEGAQVRRGYRCPDFRDCMAVWKILTTRHCSKRLRETWDRPLRESSNRRPPGDMGTSVRHKWLKGVFNLNA